MKAISEVITQAKVWTKGISSMLYDCVLSWFKLTTILLVVLAAPLFLYVLYDMLTSEMTVFGYIFTNSCNLMEQYPGTYLVVLSAILYLTITQREDLIKSRTSNQSPIKAKEQQGILQIIQTWSRGSPNRKESVFEQIKGYVKEKFNISKEEVIAQKDRDIVRETLMKRQEYDEQIRRRKTDARVSPYKAQQTQFTQMRTTGF